MTLNKTLMLIKVLGPNPPSTVNTRLLCSLSKHELYELYMYARLNKLGYTFLKCLKEAEVIDRYPRLLNELTYYENLYYKFIHSIQNIHLILNKLGIKHVFIKTIYSIPVLPGDIDVLIDNIISTYLTKALMKEGFIPFDRGPHFISLYNKNIDQNIPRRKKPYDIDLYDEISLNFLVYLDKKYFINEVEEVKICTSKVSETVPVPSTEHKLIIDLNHALFEQLFTLLHFYIVILSLKKADLNKLIKLAYVTRSIGVLRYALTISEYILGKLLKDEDLYEIYSKIHIVKNALRPGKVGGIIPRTFSPSPESHEGMPYRFHLKHIATVIMEKASTYKFSKGALLLCINTINPRMGKHIIYHSVLRRKRITY